NSRPRSWTANVRPKASNYWITKSHHIHQCRYVDKSSCAVFCGSDIVARREETNVPRHIVTLNSFQTSGSSPTARCRVGILGFGAIGSAVARRLPLPDAPSTLQLACICDRRAREKRTRQAEPLTSVTWTDQFDDLIASDVDVVVEAISGAEPA